MFAKLKEKYRYSLILLRELVRTDFKVKYQDSALGYLWSALRPLFLFAVMYIAFVKVMRVGADIDHWPVALLLGLVLWQFFGDIAKGNLKSIVSHGGLLRKLKFPRYIIVISSSVSALITLAINIVVVAVFAVINQLPFTPNLLLVIPVILLVFVFGLGVAFFLSAIYVKFRDIEHIWDIFMQGLFYGSAIIFPMSLVLRINGIGTLLAQILLMNPVSMAIQEIRHFAVNPVIPSLSSIAGENWWLMALPLVITVLFFVAGVFFFKKRSPNFAEDV
ncbi:MAG: ABC transporter permease [Candidatus Nomurabacteria bacterium]|jgi:ABC-2 type transport system permease protein|nr:ABC transporter permease [Candidatus Nomurabacteria bacterium]